jgi:hypothetical protein
MTKKTLRDWSPEQELAALLGALSAEVLAASDDEVRACLHAAGAKGRNSIETVRRLASAADVDSDAASVSNFVVAGLPVHLTRSQ